MKEIYSYIRRIRNARKRGFAERYLEWRLGSTEAPYDHSGGPADESAYEQPSLMGAQAVRFVIDTMLSPYGETKDLYK